VQEVPRARALVQEVPRAHALVQEVPRARALVQKVPRARAHAKQTCSYQYGIPRKSLIQIYLLYVTFSYFRINASALALRQVGEHRYTASTAHRCGLILRGTRDSPRHVAVCTDTMHR